MRRSSILLIVLALAVSSALAGDIVKVSIVYDYISDNTSESVESARQQARERAKVKALEEHFGTDVQAVNALLLRSTVKGESASSSTDLFSVSQTAVRGEWIETTKEEILDEKFEHGFWHIRISLAGKARNHSTPKTDIKYAFVNNAHDRQSRDQYLDGDDIYMRFSTPVSGSVCVYLVDEDNMAYCLLPYQHVQTGCQHVEANKEYVFFSTAEDRMADEYTVNCQRSVEHNTLYVVYTPNALTKANDRHAGKNWRDEQMPRQLSYQDLISWLAKNQTRDAEMVVKTDVITIRK